MVPLALADVIEIEPDTRLSFRCDDGALYGKENLALRALQAVEAATGSRLQGNVTLRKRIPVQSGLGGGSSDAATILLAAAEGRFGALPPFDVLEAARGLGSDVPFFLVQTAALVEGTGERVTALGAVPPWCVLLVKPPVSVSTARAYSSLDSHDRTIRPRNTSVSLRCVDAFQHGDFDAVEELLSNDFDDLAMEQAAIRHARNALREAGARRPLLAGSGSCVFAIARDVTERDVIARRLQLPDDFAIFSTEFTQSDIWRS